jgi:hypothetical protein
MFVFSLEKLSFRGGECGGNFLEVIVLVNLVSAKGVMINA